MRKKGEENVHFLDRLHTKLYLGENYALLGSPNLSDNDFSDSGKFEAGVVISESSSLKKLGDIFKGYKEQAIRDYPTPGSKLEKLKQLTKLRNKANWNSVDTACNDENPPSIGDYQLTQLYRIHIVWYIPGDLNYNWVEIAKVVPAIGLEANDIDLNDYFSDWCPFREEDSINEGDWILLWRSTNYGLPHGRANLRWMQLHCIIPNGVYDTPWTMLACQSHTWQTDPEPFFLDAQTTNLIREALTLDRFHNLRWSSDDEYNNWQLAPADELVPEFLQYIKEQYQQNNHLEPD